MKNKGKSTGKSTGIEASLLEVEAFKAFVETGDVTGFLALADACDAGEEGVGRVRNHFAALLRAVGGECNPAVHWFYVHGNKSHVPELESKFQGHLRSAARLAWFEGRAIELLKSGTWRYEWAENDDDYLYDDDEDAPNSFWSCRIYETVPASRPGSGWRSVTLLHGIDLGRNGHPTATALTDGGTEHGIDPNQYCRVVMTTLAEEALIELNEPIPTWLALDTPTTKEIGIPRWADLGRGMFHSPIVQGELVVILPCVPAQELLWDDSVQGRKACRAFFMHEGKLQETFYTHSQFMEFTTRLNTVTDFEELYELIRALRERNIEIDVRETAPRGYRHAYRDRRAEMRKNATPF